MFIKKNSKEKLFIFLYFYCIIVLRIEGYFMILRKPYAFLIKHFKLIHLIITVLTVYVAFCTSNSLNFINNFFKSESGKAYALQYINYLVVVAIILSIIIVGIITWLMRYKNKPRFIYYCFIIVYTVVLVFTFVSFSELNAIFTADYTLKGLKAVRDLLRISLIFQYYFIFCMLVRGLGFDIKRFNFRKDLEEFNINESDNEEVEIAFESDGTLLQRKGRRSLRELKYYYIENKTVIHIILLLVIVGGILYVVTDKKVVNVSYSENDYVTTGNYKLGVVSSYITDLSDTNKKILGDDETFCIVKFAINTTNDYKYKINPDYLNLVANGNSYLPVNKYSKSFTEIGTSYNGQYITSNTKYFILIYTIKKTDINSNMQFEYLGNYEGASNVKISINPIDLSDEKTNSISIGNKITFKDTILGDTYLEINKYEISNKYDYNYCYEEDCSYTAMVYSNSNNILKLDVNYVIDSSVSLEDGWNDIFNRYVDVYYVIDDVTYNSLINYTKTPSDIANTIYMEVDKNIENASNIWLEFSIRNKVYKYVLK